MTTIEGIDGVPVRTPTLPPATHTNCWVVGKGLLTVVDPASPWEDEQTRLFESLRSRMDAGERVERLFLTHHHADHVSGAVDLKERLAGLGFDVPIAAHPETATLLLGEVAVDDLVHDGDVLPCGRD